MVTRIDPNRPLIANQPNDAATPTEQSKNAVGPQDIKETAVRRLDVPTSDHVRPTGASQTSPLHKQTEALLRQLRAGEIDARKTALIQAIALATSYPLRRSRGSRGKAIELCDAALETATEETATLELLREVLLADGDLQEMTAAATLNACYRLMALLNDDRNV